MPDTNLVLLRKGEPVVEFGDDVSTLAGIALRRGDIATIEPWRPLLTMTAGPQSEIDDVIARVGELWRTGELPDAQSAWEATRAHTPGGPPEHRPYGFYWWIGCGYFGAGYLGQLLWVSGDAVVASNTRVAFVQ